MSADLTHEQAADEIEAVVLGIAADDVSQGVARHAAQCAECAAELNSFYQVVTALSALIPARQLNRGHSAGIKSRLFAKATAGQEAGAGRRATRVEAVRSPEPRAPETRQPRIADDPAAAMLDRSRIPIWIAVVATLIAAGSVAALLNARGERDAIQNGGTDTSTAASRVAELERAVAEKNSTIASLAGPGVRIISLFNREAREPLARMFWDRRSERWTLFVYSLRQPRPGKTFQVWLGTDGGRVSLGTFQPASDGTATFSAQHPLAITALNTVSISEENAGGAGTPTGPVVLAGALR